jgi:Xaa-Pro aminopeptidase
LLINPDEAILLTDSRYDIQSREETADVAIVLGRDVVDFVKNNCATQKLLVEGNHLSVTQFSKLSGSLDFPVDSADPVVEKLRIVKDEDEIGHIEKACAISIAALTEISQSNPRGLSERQLAIKLERLMIDGGAEAIAFESIVASGSNSAIPHHQPSDRIIAEGDLLKIDFGAQYAGYKSDCTRTFVVGSPSAFHLDLYSAVHEAQYLGCQAVRKDQVCSDIDAAVRRSLQPHEFGGTFQHGLGHGVGLAIHEDPFFGAKNDTRLACGTVVTIEPGLYVEGRGGVRIEDTIVVTDDGYRNLTDFSYDLISL